MRIGVPRSINAFSLFAQITFLDVKCDDGENCAENVGACVGL